MNKLIFLTTIAMPVFATIIAQGATEQACKQEQGAAVYAGASADERIVELYGDTVAQLHTLLAHYGRIQKNSDGVLAGKALQLQKVACQLQSGVKYDAEVARFAVRRDGAVKSLGGTSLPSSARLIGTSAEGVAYLMPPKLFGRGKIAMGVLIGGNGSGAQELESFIGAQESPVQCMPGGDQATSCQFTVSEDGRISN